MAICAIYQCIFVWIISVVSPEEQRLKLGFVDATNRFVCLYKCLSNVPQLLPVVVVVVPSLPMSIRFYCWRGLYEQVSTACLKMVWT